MIFGLRYFAYYFFCIKEHAHVLCFILLDNRHSTDLASGGGGYALCFMKLIHQIRSPFLQNIVFPSHGARVLLAHQEVFSGLQTADFVAGHSLVWEIIRYETAQHPDPAHGQSVPDQMVFAFRVYGGLNELEGEYRNPLEQIENTKWLTLGLEFETESGQRVAVEGAVLETPQKRHGIA